MRRVYLATCLVLLSAAPLLADSPAGVRLPVAPVAPAPPPAPPSEPSKLAADQFYVIDSDIPLLVLASPADVVKVVEEPGPIRLRGRFVDGDGKIESRTYKGKHVFIIEAAKTGRVELLLVPVGATKTDDVIRRSLDVDAGAGPRPPPVPPDPKPDPKPAPQPATWVIIVEQSEKRTPAVASLLNDTAMWKRIEAKGVKYRIYDADSPDAKAKKYDFVAAQVGLPCVILLDAAGNVVGRHKLPQTAAELESLVK